MLSAVWSRLNKLECFFATEDRFFRFSATGPAAAAPDIKHFLSSIELGKTNGIDVSGLFYMSDTGETVYLGKNVDVKARLIKKPKPAYTNDARDNKVEGPWLSGRFYQKLDTSNISGSFTGSLMG